MASLTYSWLHIQIYKNIYKICVWPFCYVSIALFVSIWFGTRRQVIHASHMNQVVPRFLFSTKKIALRMLVVVCNVYISYISILSNYFLSKKFKHWKSIWFGTRRQVIDASHMNQVVQIILTLTWNAGLVGGYCYWKKMKIISYNS